MDRTKWIAGGLAGLVALALAWWLFAGRQGDGTQAPVAEQAASRSAGLAEIAVSPEQAASLSLRFADAVAAQAMPIATLPAMIVPPPNARVAVAAQLPGVVTRIFVVEGEAVRAGQTLATVSSRDIVTLNAELARARARLGVAQANAARMTQLAREGIVAPARADEAQASLRQAQVDVAEQSRLIGMAHGSSGGGYTLTAPIAGRISMMTIETGKALDPGAAPFVIDAGGDYQAQAQLPERLVGTVQPGMAVRIGQGVEGRILAVGSALDPATRSATVTARLPATAAIRAGQAVSLVVMGAAPAGAVRVPADAIAQVAGEAAVFVRTAKGVAVRPVRLADGGAGSEGERVILSGLKPGEKIAVSAVSELKALAAAQ